MYEVYHFNSYQTLLLTSKPMYPDSLPVTLHEKKKRKKEQTVVVECKGHDAARINDVQHAHG